MKTWIKSKIFDFVDYVKEIKNFSDSTEKTYIINLKEAVKYVDVWEDENYIYVDLMPYRIHIKDRAKKTIAKKISIFRSYISYLKKNNIKIKLKNDDNISTEKTLPKPVKHHYIEEALSKASLLDKVIIELIYGLGLRVSELENLKLENIKNGWVIIKGKGGKIRQLSLIDRVEKLLEHYMSKEHPVEYVVEKDAKGLTSQQIRYRLAKVFKDIGLKVTPHQLRHSFATELLENGAKISDVSLLLGHSSLESTQIYTKLSSSQKSKNYKKAHPLSKLEEPFV